MTAKSLSQWRKDGGHLPDILKDFHDQKDVFKAMHAMYEGKPKANERFEEISWVSGQCYVIDWFLWFMAMHGYTLQRSRAKVEFKSLDETIDADRKKMESIIGEMMKRSAAE